MADLFTPWSAQEATVMVSRRLVLYTVIDDPTGRWDEDLHTLNREKRDLTI